MQVEGEREPDNAAADDRDLHRSSPRKSAAIVGRGANEDKHDERVAVLRTCSPGLRWDGVYRDRQVIFDPDVVPIVAILASGAKSAG